MKLCIVTPYVMKGDGQGRANYEIVWEAIRRGHTVTLLARQVAPELQEHLAVHWVSFQLKTTPTQLLQEMQFSLQSAAWLRKHRSEFDLVQVYGAVTSAPGDLNTVQFVHSAWLNSPVHTARIRRNLYGKYQWFYNWLNSQWEKAAFRQAQTVIAVSEKIRQELIEIGVPADHTEVILNGVDLAEFFPGKTDRSLWNLPENVPLALFAGDIRTNRKNLDTVLQALVHVPNLHLVVVGDTSRSPYPQMAADLQLNQRVHFLGFRRDIAQIMQAVDLFVFPSRYEACTLVLLEAMATGLPVITATTAGGAEIVTPDCGFVMSDSDDVKALSQFLAQLTNDSQLRQRMGQSAHAIAQHHSWVSKAKCYVNLFESTQKSSSSSFEPYSTEP